MHPLAAPALPDSVEDATLKARLARNQAAIALLTTWREEGDADEQRETGEYLLRVLKETGRISL